MNRTTANDTGLMQRSAFAAPETQREALPSRKLRHGRSDTAPLRRNAHSIGSMRDSATDFEFCIESEDDRSAWSGQFPLHHGGKVVFSLTAQGSFTIALTSERDTSQQIRGEAHALADTPQTSSQAGTWILGSKFC